MALSIRPRITTRRQRLTLYGIILLEVVAISFIIPSSSSTGEIPVIHRESGITSCTISSGASSCTITLIFPTAFSTIPTIHFTHTNVTSSLGYPFTIQAMTDLDLTGTNASGYWDWKVPIAETEFLNSQTDRIQADITPFNNLAGSTCCFMQWYVWEQSACTDTCILKMQYSNSQPRGAVWTDMFPTSLNIGSFAVNNCPGTYNSVPCMDSEPIGGFTPIPSGLSADANVLLRVVGSGGDGVTTARLGGIHLLLESALTNVEAFQPRLLSATTTGFTAQIDFPIAIQASTTFFFQWSATICSNGIPNC